MKKHSRSTGYKLSDLGRWVMSPEAQKVVSDIKRKKKSHHKVQKKK